MVSQADPRVANTESNFKSSLKQDMIDTHPEKSGNSVSKKYYINRKRKVFAYVENNRKCNYYTIPSKVYAHTFVVSGKFQPPNM